ncbi:MAG: hypothetical protein WC001_11680 [Desulfurivibrionaceae bacterium]
MAVDDIPPPNPVLSAALQRRVQTFVPLAASPLTLVKDPVAVATVAAQNLTPGQQTALLGAEALQALNREATAPIEPLLDGVTAVPDQTTIIESEGLSPAQQAALAVNESAQTALALQNLTPAQQAALTVNQTTQTLEAPLVVPETTVLAAAAGVAEETLPLGQAAATPAAEAATTAATTPAAAAASPTATTTPAAAATVAGTALTLAQQAANQPIPYQNAVAVYEVRNPTPPSPEPGPIRREVYPPLPIGRVRPVDPLVLRQEWEKRKRNKTLAAIPSRPPLAEKSIREMVRQANEDLAASGVPLHLVLAENEAGFALDIYECSGEAVCEITQEVPIDLNNLLTTLDNLEHETGIIVNIKT